MARWERARHELAAAANLVFNSESSGTLTLNMNILHDTEATQRTVSFNGNAETVITGGFLVAPGSVSNPLIAKGGTGQLTLTNTSLASNNNASITINAGTLSFASGNALPTGAVTG